MIILAAYLAVGLLILILHPKLRGILGETLERREGSSVWEGGLVFTGVFLFFLTFWPLALVIRRINTGREEHRLTEMKEYVASGGRDTGVSDGVLMTYRRLIEKQFSEAAKKRGERISESIMREIVLHYINHWVSANEHRLGMAMPFLIQGGLVTYREGGLEALLTEIREDKNLHRDGQSGEPS